MDANGWDITFTWLNNGIDTCNTMLVIDVLTILHDVPVTIERLQSNPGPKLVKSLSRFNFNQGIVENFLLCYVLIFCDSKKILKI